ncbi:c-type cytochrome [Mariniblastus sp.]|nr:c-type cytochrome [Mariniblastus sp.]
MEDRVRIKRKPSHWRFALRSIALVLGAFCLLFLPEQSGFADQPEWIWSPKKSGAKDLKNPGECYFRKKFTLIRPEDAEMEFAAGDEFEIYINGKLATQGQSFGQSTEMNIADYLHPGVNLIAARVRHHDGDHVGLALRIRVKEKGETRWRRLLTDESWKTRTAAPRNWKTTAASDIGWLKAQMLGAISPSNVPAKNIASSSSTPLPVASTASDFGKPLPVDPAEAAAPMRTGKLINHGNSDSNAIADSAVVNSESGKIQQTAGQRQFEITEGFQVESILASEETGSLVAMEFNEFGSLLLSQEGGPLLIADPTKSERDPERIRVYCDEVKNCQGILPLNGEVFVTGEGPEGHGLYRLADQDQNGLLEVQQKLVSFKGESLEHGAHGLQLGPDGMLYVILGNGSQLADTPDSSSPYQFFYEGDLIPRFEDPGGHALGVAAPGGTIIRVSLDGTRKEMVAGGIRNAYDLVFDAWGDLFFQDSDMESDIGSNWYRPTMVFHVPEGAEFGWRSGWSKFPQYYVDQTPAICETGRGSPTGAVLYQHNQFPKSYQGAMFFADWSEGRILMLQAKAEGASYVGQAETFLKGRPLNVVDLAVGLDGGLYFCTGGRGTKGGVYRVSSTAGKAVEPLAVEPLAEASAIARAIHHPQPMAAWARQEIAQLKIELGDQWGTGIEAVANDKTEAVEDRIRAMQLMVFFGPTPSDEMLIQLSDDEDDLVRGQVARLCGLKEGRNIETLLGNLLADPSSAVRRKAGESWMRMDGLPPLRPVYAMLGSLDRAETLVARRMLERLPAEQWENEIINSDELRLFTQGSVALMTASPSLERAYQVLAKASQWMEGYVNDHDFVDLLRAMELALVRGQVDPKLIGGFADRIGSEFPSENSVINRELIRLLAFLQVRELDGRMLEFLSSETVDAKDKIHLAFHLHASGESLDPALRLAMIATLEEAGQASHVGGNKLYVRKALKILTQTITQDQLALVFENGHQWPNAAIAAFYKLPQALDAETVQMVIDLDRNLKAIEISSFATDQVRLGVIAVLGRSGDSDSMEYLRLLWQEEPSRRNDVVIGLAQQPGDGNWAYLVSSLPVLDDLTGVEVIQTLVKVARRPRGPRHYRDLIMAGYRMRGQDEGATARLLEHWAGKKIDSEGDDWESIMRAWGEWFRQTWPAETPVSVRDDDQTNGKYSVSHLLTSIEGLPVGNQLMGGAVFEKAQCINCHQFQGRGKTMGPDLTGLGNRFSLRESIESTVHPSKTISDRYQAKSILTVDGRLLNGIARQQADESFLVWLEDGRSVTVASDDVDEIKESKQSTMPQGLLDALTISEINDLFAYLLEPRIDTVDTTEVPKISEAESNSVK